jgi:OPT family small oligopeptide transporter
MTMGVSSGMKHPLKLTMKDSFYGLETYSSDDEVEFEEYGPMDTKGNSKIPEVAATVPVQDHEYPILTARGIFISTILVIFSSFCAQFYFFRVNQVVIDSIAHIVLSYFMGIFLEKIPWKWFNPGPFNQKEHAFIVMIGSVGVSFPYSNVILVLQRLYLNQDPTIEEKGINIGWIYSILFVLSAEMMGFGLGGLFEKYLVYPAEMWWPYNLVHANLIFTFHGAITRKITRLRMKMFMGVLAAGVVYTTLPQILAPVLQSVSLLCLLSGGTQQGNHVGSQRFGLTPIAQMGSILGGGVFSVTFDWTAISRTAPLITPLWSQLNFLFSSIFFSWILTPVLYFANFWDAQKYPMYSRGSFNVDGSRYNITAILDPFTYTVRENVEPPPMRLSMNRLLVYGSAFAAISSVFVQFFLYYMKQTFVIFKTPLKDLFQKDVHTRLMQKYKQVPTWWYAFLLFGTSAMAMMVTLFNFNAFQLDFWGIPLAVALSMALVIPTGIIAAVSNQFIGANVFSQFIMGYLKPGSPLANATYKVFGTNTLIRAMSYVSNMKMAFYMKIPPRYVFFAHIYGVLISSLVSFTTFDHLIKNVPAITESAHGKGIPGEWHAINAKIIFTAAQIWGAISPERIFGRNSPYFGLYWFVLIGALLPIVFFFLQRRFPNAGLHYINWPIIFQSVGSVASGTANSILSAMVVTLVTQYYIRNKYRKWYDRYNYILSAALDLSVAFVAIMAAGVDEATPGIDLIPKHALNPPRRVFGPDYCGNVPP